MNRRTFVKLSALASGAACTAPLSAKAFSMNESTGMDELFQLSERLLTEWSAAMLRYQVNDPGLQGLHGGIMCPSCARIHGRVGDGIYPLMYMADSTGDEQYLKAALSLYQWQEQMVSMPNGAWVNGVHLSAWKGITIFGAIALAEALRYHGHILDSKTKNAWEARLKKAGDFIQNSQVYQWPSINYPITCAYTMALLGHYFDDSKFKATGRQLALEALDYFSPHDQLIFGENRPRDKRGAKGTYSVDLGYNVEESLPALVLYGKLTDHQEVLERVGESMCIHAEFMLPDGGWDNSWGMRNYKWSYWGSRTSDGCQLGYALMADRYPEFYTVALKNTQLLADCTHDQMLYGGLHVHAAGELPCMHHTFCHAKVMAAVLDHRTELEKIQLKEQPQLPRIKANGVRHFQDIATWLVAHGDWRATVTGLDISYEDFHGGHASGGALSMLHHAKLGTILSASMTDYKLWEPTNMQMDKSPYAMPLTPRVELWHQGTRYSNISDYKAEIKSSEGKRQSELGVKASLVDTMQGAVPSGGVSAELKYVFDKKGVLIKASHSARSDQQVRLVLPIISKNDEEVKQVSDQEISISKGNASVVVKATQPITVLPTGDTGRVFNFVPGLEALPLALEGNDWEVRIEVIDG